VDEYVQLGKLAPKITKTAEIGLILGQYADFNKLGIVFQLASSCQTVGEALLQTVRYSNLDNEVCRAGLKVESEIAEWSMRYISANYICTPIIEFETCQGLKILKSVLGEDFQPLGIKFQHAEPTYISKYHQLFRVPLLFEQDKCAILFKKEYLSVPNPNPRPYVKELLAKHADGMIKKIEKRRLFQDKVRKIIIQNLSSGLVNMEMIAVKLDVSSRTVYRNLRKESISYKSLLSDIQKQLAREYLKDASLSINEVSFLLGFSEASAFYRAFKRWFGTNPGQYRKLLNY
jgi:AraC-like DNA-binding protein